MIFKTIIFKNQLNMTTILNKTKCVENTDFDLDNDMSTRLFSTVHIRTQQRTGKKSLTIIEGLPGDLDQKKILKFLRKVFNTNGAVIKDERTMSDIIQLQGDIKKKVHEKLLEWKVLDKDDIVILHG